MTYCPYYKTCINQENCEQKLTEEKYNKLVESGVLFLTYGNYPHCFEIHSTGDEEDYD